MIFQALAVELILEPPFDNCSLPNIFLVSIHFRPLEWSKWLRDKERGAGRYLALSVSLILGDFIVPSCDLVRKLRDGPHILLSLRGKPQHKIQFYLIPSAFKSLSCSVQDHLLCQTFIDHVPHPLGSGLRSKSKAALPDILYLSHHVQRKRIDPERRQRNIDPLVLEFLDQKRHQLFQLTIVTGAQGA